MNDALVWLVGEVLVTPGFEVLDAAGKEVASVTARVAVQGGYLHLDVPGRNDIQMVGAPAVRRVTYRADGDSCELIPTASTGRTAAAGRTAAETGDPVVA